MSFLLVVGKKFEMLGKSSPNAFVASSQPFFPTKSAEVLIKVDTKQTGKGKDEP